MIYSYETRLVFRKQPTSFIAASVKLDIAIKKLCRCVSAKIFIYINKLK